MKLKVVTLTSLLFGLFIVIAPSNLFLVLCKNCGYVNGLLSDYLIPRLYASDFLLIALLILNWKQVLTLLKTSGSVQLKKTAFFILVLLAFVIRQFLSPHASTALWNFFQILVLSGVGWLLLTKQSISKGVWIWSLSIGLLLQTCLGWYQFWQQKPLLMYNFLGETNISRAVGIPQGSYPFLNLGERVIPHGTTAHPNILAGFIALYSVLLIQFLLKSKLSKKSNLLVTTILVASWSVLFLTQSFSGAALLTTGGIVLIGYTFFRQKKWLTIALVATIFTSGFLLSYLPSKDTSISRRQYLLQTSIEYLHSNIKNVLWGTGMSNFTAVSEEFSPSKEVVRFNQPVHNVGWLFLVENGLSGFLVLAILLLHKGRNNSFTAALVLLFPVLIWDHYLLSIQPGRELFLITFIGLVITLDY